MPDTAVVSPKKHLLYINYGTFQDFLDKSVDWQIRQRGAYEDVDRVTSLYAFAKRDGQMDLTDRHRILNVPVRKHPIHAFTTYARLVRTVLRLIRDGGVRHIWIQCHIYFLPLFVCLRLRARQCTVGVGLRADLDLAYRLGGPPESEVFLGSRALARWLEFFIFRRLCDLVLPRSENLIGLLVSGGVPRRKIVLQRFELPEDFRADVAVDDDFRRHYMPDGRASVIFSFVGRMTRYNYVYDVLDMFERVLKFEPDAALVMAGRGPEEEEVRRQVSARGISSRVILPGFVKRDDVLKLRRMSDFSMCLMGGNSMLEAAAVGSVVVAYDVDWHRELVAHMENGVVVPEGDVDALVDAVRRVRASPEMKERFARRSADVIRQKYRQGRISIFARAEEQI